MILYTEVGGKYLEQRSLNIKTIQLPIRRLNIYIYVLYTVIRDLFSAMCAKIAEHFVVKQVTKEFVKRNAQQ